MQPEQHEQTVEANHDMTWETNPIHGFSWRYSTEQECSDFAIETLRLLEERGFEVFAAWRAAAPDIEEWSRRPGATLKNLPQLLYVHFTKPLNDADRVALSLMMGFENIETPDRFEFDDAMPLFDEQDLEALEGRLDAEELTRLWDQEANATNVMTGFDPHR